MLHENRYHNLQHVKEIIVPISKLFTTIEHSTEAQIRMIKLPEKDKYIANFARILQSLKLQRGSCPPFLYAYSISLCIFNPILLLPCSDPALDLFCTWLA